MEHTSNAPATPKQQIGGFTFVVLRAHETPENRARWDRRAEVLAELLLKLWRDQQSQRSRGPA